MNLFEILKSKVSSTSPGLHVPGLRAVAAHIDAANRHFTRGQSDQDETAFTDAIYRCNQAFEGSIKEAYRVLAQKDPSRETVNAIEEYLSKNDVLRPRILVQLKNYRQEWRGVSDFLCVRRFQSHLPLGK
jgi:hypothetical protein